MMTKTEFDARLIKRAWEDEDFRKALSTNPKETIEKDFGIELPKVTIKVLENTDDVAYFVIPKKPVSGELKISPDELDEKMRYGTMDINPFITSTECPCR